MYIIIVLERPIRVGMRMTSIRIRIFRKLRFFNEREYKSSEKNAFSNIFNFEYSTKCRDHNVHVVSGSIQSNVLPTLALYGNAGR